MHDDHVPSPENHIIDSLTLDKLLTALPIEDRLLCHWQLWGFDHTDLGLSKNKPDELLRKLQTVAGISLRCPKCRETREAAQFGYNSTECLDCEPPHKRHTRARDARWEESIIRNENRECLTCRESKPLEAYQWGAARCISCDVRARTEKRRKERAKEYPLAMRENLVAQLSVEDRVILRLFVRRGLFEPDEAQAMLTWPHSGFHVHDAVLVPDGDVAFALRLARYCARNPVALERLEYDAAARQVRYRSDKADGPTAGTETGDPLEFLARVTAHVSNRHQVLTRYYGYYANRVRGRGARAGKPRELRPRRPPSLVRCRSRFGKGGGAGPSCSCGFSRSIRSGARTAAPRCASSRSLPRAP